MVVVVVIEKQQIRRCNSHALWCLLNFHVRFFVCPSSSQGGGTVRGIAAAAALAAALLVVLA